MFTELFSGSTITQNQVREAKVRPIKNGLKPGIRGICRTATKLRSGSKTLRSACSGNIRPVRRAWPLSRDKTSPHSFQPKSLSLQTAAGNPGPVIRRPRASPSGPDAVQRPPQEHHAAWQRNFHSRLGRYAEAVPLQLSRGVQLEEVQYRRGSRR